MHQNSASDNEENGGMCGGDVLRGCTEGMCEDSLNKKARRMSGLFRRQSGRDLSPQTLFGAFDDRRRHLIGVGIGGGATVFQSPLPIVLHGGDRDTDGGATV